MNNYDEIKSLLNASRRIIGGSLQENQNNEILRKHRLITEDEDINMGERTDDDVIDTKKDSEEIGKPAEKQRGYKIQGNILILHGTDETDLELTSDEKNAFIESVDQCDYACDAERSGELLHSMHSFRDAFVSIKRIK